MKPHPILKDIYSDALEWINQLLQQHAITPVDTLTVVREMAWSTVARIDHDQGVWYFKCLPDYFKHELAISDFCYRLKPDLCAEVIAMDLDRGFLIINDAGPMFREHLVEKPESEIWLKILPEYAKLQIAAMKHPDFNALSIPNRSITRLPQLVMPSVEYSLSVYVEDKDEQFLDRHFQILKHAFENWSDWVDPLYQFGISDTLNHGDLHDGNIAWQDKATIFDWGDASRSHPFVSLRSVIVSIERRFGFMEGSLEMEPFIQAYLEPWKTFALYDDLRIMVEKASKVWSLVTFLNWTHALQNHNDPRIKNHHYALPVLLREFVDAQD